MSLIHYDIPGIEAAHAQLLSITQQTEDNHQQSLRIVNANADNFGGQGSDAFQHAIAQVNHRYAQSQETLSRAGVALDQAKQGMQQADSTSAAQYQGA